MFIDLANIYVKAGDGGNGCISFRREKYVPRGGPDGGDGGRGGHIIFKAYSRISTLLDLKKRVHYVAENGRDGQGKKMAGRDGHDWIIEVPPGTIIRDKDTGLVLKDLVSEEQSVCIAKAGRGGRGNKAFATATNQTPREAEDGEPGEERRLELELKLIADVGLVGMPNAGKSTILSRLSAAHPKIADYPFTTLEPQLGIVEAGDFRRIVMADIPGLIEGAHAGAGLGDEFLRHIERTKIIMHVVDICPVDNASPAKTYRTIREELKLHSDDLAQKPEIIVANKMDLTDAEKNLQSFSEEVDKDVIPISAATKGGLDALIKAMLAKL